MCNTVEAQQFTRHLEWHRELGIDKESLEWGDPGGDGHVWDGLKKKSFSRMTCNTAWVHALMTCCVKIDMMLL